MDIRTSKSLVRLKPNNESAHSLFESWGKRFFAYLVREKSLTNPALLDLIYCLLADGRRELALCVFNFLRTDQWNQFCRERRVARCKARKLLSAAKLDLQKAAMRYGKMLASIPELGSYRNIGYARPTHFSDLLEEEATFIAAQARIMRCAKSKSMDVNASKTDRLCSKVAVALTHAARSYRKLLTLTETVQIAAYFPSFSPRELKARLESEAANLAMNSTRVNSAFNKKRIGIKADWASLVRLQDFIEEFGLCLAAYWPMRSAKRLSESDLADLLEAGEYAWDPRKKRLYNDPDSIGRTMERFRQRETNALTCVSLRCSAQEICDGLARWNRFQGPFPTLNIQFPLA